MIEFRTNENEVIEYSDLEIESLKDHLEMRARETGDAHSEMMVNAGRGPTPNAYKASALWHAIEVIEQLQRELQLYQSLTEDKRF